MPVGCVFLQNLTNQDSYALVFSLFEMSLPVLQQPPGEWHPQQQTPGLRLDVTLPFITQAAADKGLTTIAKVCVCACLCACVCVRACAHFALCQRGCAARAAAQLQCDSSGVQHGTQEAAGLNTRPHTSTLVEGSVTICLACVLCMVLCAALEQHALAGGAALQPG